MKEIKSFIPGDKIPSNASFLSVAYCIERADTAFYYEIPIVEESKAIAKKKDESKEIIDSVLDYLNYLTGRSYSSRSKATVQVIRARLNDGYSKGDLMQVIVNMTAAWLDDDKMSQYLRPETLFRASKIEGYLNYKSGAQQASEAFKELEDLTNGN